MIQRLYLYRGNSFDPYYNLAVEQCLLEKVQSGECILYLWQNENTVVIGRNQNPWKECDTARLAQEGGHLARRLSGGGAVFHDLGNLNFTFLLPQEEYDLDRQLEVIRQAVESLGIPAERSGRNDLLTGGRKFSGNAFYKNGHQAYHHGTLLLDVNREKMSRYLSPSKAKLQSKGVDSVRSRVVNLKELNPQITVAAMVQAMETAFGAVYGCPVERISSDVLNHDRVDELFRRNQSWQWNYGAKIPFTSRQEQRFSWGEIQIELQVQQGRIEAAKVYSDAMEWDIAPALEKAITGGRFLREEMEAAICAAAPEYARELITMLPGLGL